MPQFQSIVVGVLVMSYLKQFLSAYMLSPFMIAADRA